MDDVEMRSEKTALVLGLIFLVFIMWIVFGRPGAPR